MFEVDVSELVRARVDLAFQRAAPGLDAIFDVGVQRVVDRAKQIAPKVTSALAGSIRAMPAIGSIAGGHRSMAVEAGTTGIGVAVPYAMAVEYGSGLHAEGGSRGKYPIRPVNKKALFFSLGPNGPDVGPIGGVMHPGVKPRPYLRPALIEVVPSIVDDLTQYLAHKIVMSFQEVSFR